jgi:hypothetical protein
MEIIFPIGRFVALANKQTMSMKGNSSLQQAERAMISAPSWIELSLFAIFISKIQNTQQK